jgi:fumarate reductase subunit C
MNQGVVQAKLWYAQRISAMVLGICVAVHLVIIFYAIRGTQGNALFAFFYEIFILACFVHAPIGMANILQETFPKSGIAKPVASTLGLFILVLGSIAVIGLYTGGAS